MKKFRLGSDSILFWSLWIAALAAGFGAGWWTRDARGLSSGRNKVPLGEEVFWGGTGKLERRYASADLGESGASTSLSATAATQPEELVSGDPLMRGGASAQQGLQKMLASLGATIQSQREDFLRGAFRRAATLGVPTALEWVENLPDNASRNTALLTLYCEWAGVSAASAVEASGSGGIAGAVGSLLLRKNLAAPEEVARFAKEHLRGALRANLLAEVAAQWVSTDPERAFALGDSLAGGPLRIFLNQFAGSWAQKSPAEAWSWAARIEDPRIRAELQQAVFQIEAAKSPESALVKLSEIEPGSSLKVSLTGVLAAAWAGLDTQSALRWAGALPEEGERDSARRAIEAVAPVGIGVRFVEEDGGIRVFEVLQGGAAAQSDLQAGDRILAVSSPEGLWLDVRNRTMLEAVELIRGRPGSVVSLQVENAKQNTTRTVSIQRGQVLWTPKTGGG